MKMSKKGLIIGGITVIVGTFSFLGIRRLVLSAKRRKGLGEGDQKVDVGGVNLSLGKIKVGDSLYPKGSYVVLRNSAKVNDSIIHNPSGKASIWDVSDNIITERQTGLIGTVEKISTGETDGLTWYYVKFPKPINADFKDYNYGWVRSDVVKK